MLQRLPPELINLIVEILISTDINSASHLLQSCQSLSQSEYYDRVRYLALRHNLGYTTQKRLPTHLRHEADMLVSMHRTMASQGHDSPSKRGVPSESFVWNQIPKKIVQGDAAEELSGAAKMFRDYLYDLSSDSKTLYCWQIAPYGDATCREKLLLQSSICFDTTVVAYDVDLDEGILAVLAVDSDESLTLLVYEHGHRPDKLLQRHYLSNSPSPKLMLVEINGTSILLNIDNDILVYDWKQRDNDGSGGRGCCIWSRSGIAERSSEGWYVRGCLFSPQVVACILISTYRTIGSMRIGHGVVELYRLDQMVPRVADIILPDSNVDALHPRLLQDPYSYISFNLGGKMALQNCLRGRYDGPALLQTFSTTRIGTVSTLCDMLYPRAALALYSMDPSRPSFPVLRSEWLRSNFPNLDNVQSMQASVDGQRVLSSAKGDRHLLTFSLARLGDDKAKLLQPLASQDLSLLLDSINNSLDAEKAYHIEGVKMDGPRAFFICYRCKVEHNGSMYAISPLCSFYTLLQQ